MSKSAEVVKKKKKNAAEESLLAQLLRPRKTEVTDPNRVEEIEGGTIFGRLAAKKRQQELDQEARRTAEVKDQKAVKAAARLSIGFIGAVDNQHQVGGESGQIEARRGIFGMAMRGVLEQATSPEARRQITEMAVGADAIRRAIQDERVVGEERVTSGAIELYDWRKGILPGMKGDAAFAEPPPKKKLLGRR